MSLGWVAVMAAVCSVGCGLMVRQYQQNCNSRWLLAAILSLILAVVALGGLLAGWLLLSAVK